MAKGHKIIITITLLIFLSVHNIYAQPAWINGTPAVDSTGIVTISLNYGISSTGYVYIIVYNFNNTSVLTSSTVRSRAILGSGGDLVETAVINVKRADAGKILQVVLSVNDPGTIHTIYIVAADSKGRLQASPVRLNTTTLPCQQATAGEGGDNCGLEFYLNAVQGPGTGTWTRESGPGSASFSPNNHDPLAKVTVSSYGTYVFRWTEVIGPCTSYSTVTVGFLEQISANAGNGGDECDLNFNLNAIPGQGTGTWSLVSGPGNAVFSPDAHHSDAIVTVTIPGTYDFEWREVGSNCTSSDIIRVYFHPAPSVSAGTDASICTGSSITLHAQGEGTYLWSPATTLNDPTSANPVATPTVTTNYTLILTDQWGCTNNDNVTINVDEKPVADAGPDQILNNVFTTSLSASPLKTDETGEWQVITGTGKITDSHANNTEIHELSLGDNVLWWKVSNGICPEAIDTIVIKVRELSIPSLITPNADGKNDFFVIMGIENLSVSRLVIFNRWGAEVYSSDMYKNDWDGKDDKGNILPDDTYFYIFKPEQTPPVKGYIVIKR